MLNLILTTDKLQLVTSATAAIDVHASFADTDTTMTSSSNVVMGKQNTAITTATTTDIVAAPGSNITRNVKFLSIANKDAATSNVVEVLFNANATTYRLHKITLGAGEVLEYFEGRWYHYDPSAGIYAVPSFDPATLKVLRNSSTADQSMTAASATYITGSSVLLPSTLAAGWVLLWHLSLDKTGAGTSTSSFDLRFGTNQSTGDTSRCSTGALDTETAVADVMHATVIAWIRGPIGASCIVESLWDFSDNLTTTGFSNTARKAQVKRVQSSAFDITVAATYAGLSMTAGTADVVTVRGVASFLYRL